MLAICWLLTWRSRSLLAISTMASSTMQLQLAFWQAAWPAATTTASLARRRPVGLWRSTIVQYDRYIQLYLSSVDGRKKSPCRVGGAGLRTPPRCAVPCTHHAWGPTHASRKHIQACTTSAEHACASEERRCGNGGIKWEPGFCVTYSPPPPLLHPPPPPCPRPCSPRQRPSRPPHPPPWPCPQTPRPRSPSPCPRLPRRHPCTRTCLVLR